MVRVPVPDGIDAGVFDLRSYGHGLVDVEDGAIDVPESAVDRIQDDWRSAGWDVPERGESESDGDAFAVDEWLDQDYRERADRVTAGEVDEHLDTIADAETSQTVIDAVDDRREDR